MFSLSKDRNTMSIVAVKNPKILRVILQNSHPFVRIKNQFFVVVTFGLSREAFSNYLPAQYKILPESFV